MPNEMPDSGIPSIARRGGSDQFKKCGFVKLFIAHQVNCMPSPANQTGIEQAMRVAQRRATGDLDAAPLFRRGTTLQGAKRRPKTQLMA